MHDITISTKEDPFESLNKRKQMQSLALVDKFDHEQSTEGS